MASRHFLTPCRRRHILTHPKPRNITRPKPLNIIYRISIMDLLLIRSTLIPCAIRLFIPLRVKCPILNITWSPMLCKEQLHLPATLLNLPATLRNLSATLRNLPATLRNLPATLRHFPATQRNLPVMLRKFLHHSATTSMHYLNRKISHNFKFQGPPRPRLPRLRHQRLRHLRLRSTWARILLVNKTTL